MPKKDFNINEELHELVNRLLALHKEHLNLEVKENKLTKTAFKDNSKISGREGYEYGIERDAIKITNNALLTYSFSLYEIFLANLLKNLANSDNKVWKILQDKWLKFLSEVSAGQHSSLGVEGKFLDNLTKQKKINRYEILIKAANNGKGTTLSKFLKDLQGINKISRNNKIVKRYIAEYAIFREIRNLLIHRGSVVDKKFISSISSNADIGQDKKELEQFFSTQFQTRNKKIISKPNKLIGKEIRINFSRVINNLIFNAMWHSCHFSAQKNTHLVSIPGNFFNDLVSHDEENMEHNLSIVIFDLFHAQEQCLFNNDVKKIPDVDKFNYLLAKHFYTNSMKKNINTIVRKKKAPEKAINMLKKIIQDLEEEYDIAYKKYFNFLHNESIPVDLLNNYLKNRKKDFIHEFKKHNFDKDDIEGWFIFKRYKKDKEFIKISTSKIKKDISWN